MKNLTIRALIASVSIAAMLTTGCGAVAATAEAASSKQAAASTSESTEDTDAAEDTDVSDDTSDTDGETDGLLVEIDDLDLDDQFSKRDSDASYDEESASVITFAKSGAEVSGSGVTADGSVVTITEAGTYIVSGETSDGQIVIAADEDNDKVQLVLDGVSMTNDDGPCILVKSADKVFITLADGSRNTLSDTGDEYVQEDDVDSNIDGVIYSVSDLTLNGSGSLTVDANTDNGIVSKDDLVITGGTYEITAAGKGIQANDSIRIKDGDITVDSEDDAIHTSNEDTEGKGYIYIEGGTLNLKSGDDGIHAGTALIVNGGDITVADSYEGMEGDSIDILDGTIDITADDDGLNASTSSAQDTDNMSIDQRSGNAGGGPNGNAQSQMEPPQGDLTGESESRPGADEKSTEDRQSPAGNGDFKGSFGGRGGMGMGMGNMGGGMGFDADPNAYIHISGGTVTVDANGDGIDSNGELVIDGGTVTVYGPTNSGNGALDVGTDCLINGGTVYIAGSAGMAVSFDDDSEQDSITYTFDTVQKAGTSVTLEDSDGTIVMEMTPEKDFQNVIFSSEDLAAGEYTITAGDESAEVSIGG